MAPPASHSRSTQATEGARPSGVVAKGAKIGVP